MTGTAGNTNAACAACKYQRRKCSPDCPLSPYFPPDQPKRFANVHRLFGVSNILRILKHVDPSKREDTVKSIAYEADTREKDPVHGCLGVITVLQSHVAKLKEDLNLAREQLFLLEHQQQQVTAHGSSMLNSFHGAHASGLSTAFSGSSFEDDDSQFLRNEIGFHDSHHSRFDTKFESKIDTKYDQKMNILALPLDYRYEGDDASSLMSQIKADQAEQLRRAGSYFGIEPAFDESPVSHHQMHLQAALEQDHMFGIRQSPTSALSCYGAMTEANPIKPANYLLAGSGSLCHIPDHDVRRAGVYLTLTNEH